MKWQRKRILVHNLQIKYSFYAVMAMAVIMVLTFLNVCLDTISIVNTILPERGGAYIVFSDFFSPLLLIKAFLIIVVIFLFGILFSHRIAGPLYRFKDIFQRIGRGELNMGEVRLRKKDELQGETQELNSMIKGLRDIIDETKKDIDMLLSQGELNSKEAKELLGRLREKISFFKT